MVFSNAQWMTPPASGSVVSVGNSALFNSANSEDLSRGSMSGTATTWTASFWVYRGDNGQRGSATAKMMFTTASDAGLSFGDNSTADVLAWYSGSYTATTRLFRDVGWYHMVVKNVAGTGIVYVNGDIVLFGLTVPTADATMAIGSYNNSSSHLDGYMAEWVFIDGTALEPTSFAGYDSTGTFWTPLSSATIKGLTFGTNGFYLDNTTNAQTDASGNGNNLTNNNTVTTSTHTPTNIEFLMSPIFTTTASNVPTLSNGNRTYTDSATEAQTRIGGTIVFPNSGKWLQGVSLTDTDNGKAFGVWTDYSDSQGFPNTGNFLGWHLTTVMNGYNSSGSSPFSLDSNFTASDQFWIAVDIDNSKVWLGFYDDSASTITWYAADGGTDGNPATGDNPLESIDCSGMVFAGAAQKSKAFTLVKEADCPFTIPTGYSFLSTTSLAANITRTKSNLEEYFSTTTYEGNGAGQRVGKFLPFTDTFTVGNSGLFKLVSTSQNTSNPRLTRTQDAGGSNKKFSFSFWYKRGQLNSSRQTIWNNDPTATASIRFNPDNTIVFEQGYAVGAASSVTTTRVLTDTSQWYNVIIVIDTTQATASDRQTIYINGVSQTLAIATQLGQNADTSVGGADSIAIGSFIASSSPSFPFDGYLAEFVYVNNQVLSPSDVGQVDTSTGRWIPKTLGGLSFGSTDYYLNFATLGEDVSGNDNDFTNANVVQEDDTPTVNFGTLIPVNVSNNGVLSNGNRTNTGTSGGSYSTFKSGLNFTTEKIFVTALVVDGASGADVSTGIGVAPDSLIPNGNTNPVTGTWGYAMIRPSAINIYALGASAGNHSISVADGDQLTMAVDGNTGDIWFGFYDTSAGTHQYLPPTVGGTAGNPALGTLPTIPNSAFNGGKNVIYSGGYGTGSSITFNLDSSDMPISLPTNYLEFKQDNLTEGESYQTAFSWIKNRDATDNHMVFDRLRGIYNNLHFNTDDAQNTNVNTLQRFLNGGVQVGNDVQVNTVNESYVAWNWYFETTGSGSSNTDGTINTTSTLVDTNLGLSISQYTGTGNNATVGHGLGVAPEFIITKTQNLGSAGNSYYCYHIGLNATAPANKRIILNSNAAGAGDSSYWNDTVPTSSVFSLGTTTNVNGSGTVYISYAFAPSQFTAIGSYKGNGNANGSFVPTINSLGIPIQPAWVMIKRSDAANNWCIRDIVRDANNPNEKELDADLSNAEITNSDLDIVTGGFKLRANDNLFNNSSGTYIYLAFGTPIIDVDGRIITGR